MPHVVIHQSAILKEDFVYDLPGDCIVHSTTSDDMDCDGWLKSASHFGTALGATTRNHPVLFFDDHESHYNYNSFYTMASKLTKPFILKVGDIKIDQPI